MGYAVRSERFRLVLWRDYRDPGAEPVFVELYDHKTDPDETVNVAPGKPGVVAELTVELNRILNR